MVKRQATTKVKLILDAANISVVPSSFASKKGAAPIVVLSIPIQENEASPGPESFERFAFFPPTAELLIAMLRRALNQVADHPDSGIGPAKPETKLH